MISYPPEQASPSRWKKKTRNTLGDLLKQPQTPLDTPVTSARSSFDSVPPEGYLSASDEPIGTVHISGPVIDPETGALQRGPLRETAAAIIRSLPELPADAHSSRRRLHDKLVGTLQEIIHSASDDNVQRPHELGLEVRDYFAKASKAARVLATSLDHGSLLRGTHSDKPLAAAYLGVSGLLNELKRLHLSAVAQDIADHYAEKETRNLERAARNLSMVHGGSGMSTTHGISVGIYTPLSAVLPKVGGDVSGTTTKSIISDDNREINYFTLTGGVGDQNTAIKPVHGPFSLDNKASIGVNVGRTYYEHGKLLEVVKLIANDDANGSMFGSAGPHMRAAKKLMQEMRHSLNRGLLGHNYSEAPGLPYYLNDKKVAKGRTQIKAQLLAQALDRHAMDNRFSSLLGAAYPPTDQLLTMHLADKGQVLPANREHVGRSGGYSRNHGGQQQVNLNNTFSASAGGGLVRFSARFIGQLNAQLLQFYIGTDSPQHVLLDPGHLGDMRSVFNLHSKLEDLCRNPSPEFSLYDRVRRSLMGHGQESRPMSGDDRLYYGDEIPAQFRHVVAAPSAAHLECITQVCDDLAERYVHITHDAQAVLAKPDKFLPKSEHAMLDATRLQAFERMNREVWHGNFPGGVKAALKNPEDFVAKTYSGISMALGCAGAHLAVAKREMARHGDPSIVADILAADESFARTRALLDGVYLPIKTHRAQKAGPVTDDAKWRRMDASGIVTFGGGANATVPEWIAGIFGGKGRELEASASKVMDLTNEAGQVSGKVQVRVLRATYQPNPRRIADFVELTVGVQGGAPVIGTAVRATVNKILEQVNSGLRPGERHVSEPEVTAALRQMQGMVLDVSDGSNLVVKFRKSPGGQMRLQWVRSLEVKNSGLGNQAGTANVISARNSGPPASSGFAIPTGPVDVKVSVTSADNTFGTNFQILGSDLSAQMMNHEALARLMEKAGTHPGGLKKLFDENPYERNMFFGLKNAIVDVVKDYQDYRHAKADAAAKHRDPTAVEQSNEFFQLYETEVFGRTAQVLNETRKHAPGNLAPGDDPFEKVYSLAEGIQSPIPDLEQARQRLSHMKNMEQRVNYFCNDPQGRQLFEAFHEIVGNAQKINSGSMMHVDPEARHGFNVHLTSELENRVKEVRKAMHVAPDDMRMPVIVDALESPLGPLQQPHPAVEGTTASVQSEPLMPADPRRANVPAHVSTTSSSNSEPRQPIPPLQAGRLQPGVPLVAQIDVGQAPDDGNCFHHSLIQVARPQLEAATGKRGSELTTNVVRHHMAVHLLGLYELYNRQTLATGREQVMQLHPILNSLNILGDTELGKEIDLSDAAQRHRFDAALGSLAQRGHRLTPAQQTNLLHIAEDRSWLNEASDLSMPLAAKTFGLRLSAVGLQTTLETEAHFIYGSGDGNLLRMRYDPVGRHYEPMHLRT